MILWSSTVTTWPVRPADAGCVSSSSGLIVAALITSADIPSAASCFAASSALKTGPPVADEGDVVRPGEHVGLAELEAISPA